jgi:hypothetical protein
MLKFSFLQENLERALADDLLLQHLVHDRWFALPVLNSGSAADESVRNCANHQPIDWKRWPQCESKDA